MSEIEFIPGTPGEKYCPSNGDEGLCFDSMFCDRCKKDQKYREDMDADDGCKIIVAAMINDADSPDYPSEWCYGEDGQPKCTAFEPVEG